MDLARIQAMEDAYQLKTYSKFPLAIESGRGVEVKTVDAETYLDFYGGHAVALTGHCHPKVVGAIKAQAEKLLFYSNIVYHELRAEAAKAVVDLAPAGIGKVFFCNSGAEANETALKIARKFTGRTGIVAMEGSFHGRTYGAMSITEGKKYRQFPPFVPGIAFAQFGSIESLVEKIKEQNGDTACVILEPVQSMAGVKIAPPQYYQMLREVCDDNGIVLVFDEVQTGFGRCGVKFFGDAVGVTPDIITGAKGAASGVPVGLTLVSERIAETIGLGEQGSTFGGGPLAMAACKATMDIIVEEKLAEHAQSMGAYLVEKIQSADISGLKQIRGIGLLIGLEFEQDGKALVKALLDRNVITGTSDDPHTIRILPPLIINESNCDRFVTALIGAAKETR